MTISKLLLVLVSAFVQQYAATAPNVPTTDQLREQRGSERALPYVITLSKTLAWSWALFQISASIALSAHCPPSLARLVLPLLPASITSNPTTFTALNPSFLAGTFVTLTGSLLRAHCFHALGSRFTFELSIRPSHTLVTDGVYALVRHPSYTGGIVSAVGWSLCLFDLRPWVADACATRLPNPSALGSGVAMDCHAVATSAFVCLSGAVLGVLYVGLSERMDKEDAMLEKNFGDEWRAWAERVPYRLVPGVC